MIRRSHRLMAWGFGFGILVFWQLLADYIDRSFLLPGPLAVLEHLRENGREIFLLHLPATLEVVLLGSIFSVLLGILFAVLMDWDQRIRRALYPILTVTQTVPVMCIAPVFVLWFGYTVRMRVIVVVLINFFAVTVNLYDGFQSAGVARQELMMTYGASKHQLFLLLRMPAALPAFFTALRIAVPWSVIGAAVAEWLGAPSGLGTYSRSCMMNLDAAGLLAPLLVLTAIALILTGILQTLERRLVHWQEGE